MKNQQIKSTFLNLVKKLKNIGNIEEDATDESNPTVDNKCNQCQKKTTEYVQCKICGVGLVSITKK